MISGDTYSERMRQRIADLPNTKAPDPVVIWFSELPHRLREAILMLMEGYERHQERSAHLGAQKARERKERREMSA